MDQIYELFDSEEVTTNQVIEFNRQLQSNQINYKGFQQIELINEIKLSLVRNDFNWKNYSIDQVKSLSEFLKIFAEYSGLYQKEFIFMLNVNELLEIVSLKFIDQICSKANYDYGTSFYDNTLTFYTQLLEFFKIFYLDKDLYLYQKISCNDLDQYSPVSRERIRKQNINNEFIKSKYLNSEFNIIEFAKKINHAFIPGASWRTIGAYHKAHISVIQISLLIIEYGLLNQHDLEIFEINIFSKVSIFQGMEIIFDKEAQNGNIAKKWYTIWAEGLSSIRVMFMQMMIHFIFLKHDWQTINNIKNSRSLIGDNLADMLDSGKIENKINYDKSTIYNIEFSKQLQDCVLQYCLDDSSIYSNKEESEKIHFLTQEVKDEFKDFIMFFTNIRDNYLDSIGLLIPQELEMEELFFESNDTLNQEIQQINDMMSTLHLPGDKKFDVFILENLEKILQKLNQKKGFSEKENFILLKNNIVWKVQVQFLLIRSNYESKSGRQQGGFRKHRGLQTARDETALSLVMNLDD